jgi:CBS domain-containing protein
MLQRRVSGLPVINKEGRVVGMLTEGDLLRREETGTQRQRPRWLEFLVGPGKLADEYTRSRGRKVGEIMSDDPRTVSEDTPLDGIVRMMEKHQIKRVAASSSGHSVLNFGECPKRAPPGRGYVLTTTVPDPVGQQRLRASAMR